MIYQYLARFPPRYRFHRRYKQSIPDKGLRKKVLTTPANSEPLLCRDRRATRRLLSNFQRPLPQASQRRSLGSALSVYFPERNRAKNKTLSAKRRESQLLNWHTGPFGPVFEMVCEASKGRAAL